MTAYQFKEWWRYRRAAKGRHGVHSPFVYRFVEEGLRAGVPQNVRRQLSSFKTTAQEYAQAKTLYCSLKFLHPDAVHCAWAGQNLPLIESVSAQAGVRLAKENISEIAGCILVGNSNSEEMERAFSENVVRMKEGLIFIVADIHASPRNALQWLRVCQDQRVNLSIDLWHIGLLFYRADFKERQHFVLKYPA